MKAAITQFLRGIEMSLSELPSSGDQVSSAKVSNVAIALSLLFCFPVGLYFIWTHPSWTRNRKKGLTICWFVFALVLGAIMSRIERSHTIATMNEANSLWEAGDKKAAYEKYLVISRDEEDRLEFFPFDSEEFRRLIEVMVTEDEANARRWIERVQDEGIHLEFDSTKAADLYSEIENRRKELARRNELHQKEPWRAKDNYVAAYMIAKKFVLEQLHAPSTAKFPDGFMSPVYRDHTTSLGDGNYHIESWVDAQNLFGAQLRRKFTIDIEQVAKDRWSNRGLVIHE